MPARASPRCANRSSCHYLASGVAMGHRLDVENVLFRGRFSVGPLIACSAIMRAHLQRQSLVD